MPPTQWTDDFLDSMRQVTDPLADDAVDELFKQGEVEDVNSLMLELLRNDQIVPDRLPLQIQKYLQQSGKFPDWAETEKINLAEDLFSRHGMLICASLFFSSLPTCYACGKGVQVLHLTARLQTDPQRRIAETGQLILDVMAPGGLSPNGSGVRDVQKVRLMHAAIRHLIRHHPRWQPLWDPAWSEPINQEDMAGTLLSFSRLPLNTLAKLGVMVTLEECEAYNHAWNVVGHLMGVRQELLPATSDLAQELGDTIGRRNYSACPEGSAMTAALLEMMQGNMPLKSFKGLPRTMMRYLSGDEVANTIGLPADDWTENLVGSIRRFIQQILSEERHSRLLAWFVRNFSRDFLETMSTIERGGQRAPFSIPMTLSQQWELKPSALPSRQTPGGGDHP
jgi:hypothetical protein